VTKRPLRHPPAEAARVPHRFGTATLDPVLMGERTSQLSWQSPSRLIGPHQPPTPRATSSATSPRGSLSLKDTLFDFEEMNVPVRDLRLGGGGALSHLWRKIPSRCLPGTRSRKSSKPKKAQPMEPRILAGACAGSGQPSTQACQSVFASANAFP